MSSISELQHLLAPIEAKIASLRQEAADLEQDANFIRSRLPKLQTLFQTQEKSSPPPPPLQTSKIKINEAMFLTAEEMGEFTGAGLVEKCIDRFPHLTLGPRSWEKPIALMMNNGWCGVKEKGAAHRPTTYRWLGKKSPAENAI